MAQDNSSILVFILIAFFASGIVVALIMSVGEARMKTVLKTAQAQRRDPPPLAEVARSSASLGPRPASVRSRLCPRLGCHTLNDSAARYCRRCGNPLPPKMPSQA
jgi:hypothetical protein